METKIEALFVLLQPLFDRLFLTLKKKVIVIHKFDYPRLVINQFYQSRLVIFSNLFD